MTWIQSKEDARWILHDLNLTDHRVYTMFTKKWCYRWGKTYSEEKWFVLLSGRCRLTLEVDGEDEVLEFLPWELIHIEPWIPNLFFFPEDSEMIERFPINTTMEKHPRFYEMKKN